MATTTPRGGDGRRSCQPRVRGSAMFQFWLDFVNNLLRKENTATVAAGRLKSRIFLDRLNLSAATLDRIRGDVLRSISRYLVIDESAMTLAVQAEGRTVALAASIPVIKMREGRDPTCASPQGPGLVTSRVASCNEASAFTGGLSGKPVLTSPGDRVTAVGSVQAHRERVRSRALRRRRHRERLGAAHK